MGNSIKAEVGKILTTKLWWALLIPTAALAFIGSLGIAAGGNLLSPDLGAHLPLGYLSLNGSFTYACIFGAILGALGMAGENRHRTITTTYLTGARSAVFNAKLVAYGIFGLVYGLITLAFVTLGTVIPNAPDALPDAGSWLLVSLVGVIVVALWTVFGVGLAGLIPNQVAVVLTLPIYMVVGELLLRGLFGALKISAVNAYLPVQSGLGSVINLAVQLFLGQSNDANAQDVRDALGATDLPAWWVSGLVFVAWTALFCLIGWAISRRRDVT